MNSNDAPDDTSNDVNNDVNRGRFAEQAVATDLRTHELGVTVQVMDDRVVVRGEVASPERRDAVLAVVRERLPDARVRDELTLSGTEVRPPRGAEIIPAPDQEDARD